MTTEDIKLLLLIHLMGPRNPEQIETYVTSGLTTGGLAYWMPTDRGRRALALTREGEVVVSEMLWQLTENFTC